MTLSNLPTNHNYCQDAPLAKDVPSGTLTGQESHSSALQDRKYSLVAPLPTWEDLLRAERTAGGPVVSGIYGWDRTGEKIEALPALKDPSRPSGIPATNALPLTSIATTRIVNFFKLKSLLQPLHNFFKNKKAFIDCFRIYDDSSEKITRRLVYPKVKAMDKLNPYRRYQLNNKASARTFNRIKQFVENRKYDDFAVASVIPTMPKFMSEYLSAQVEGGRGMAWRLFTGFWSEDLPAVIGQNIQLACHVNLHTWRTEKPFEPHYHFHTLIPNYGLIPDKVKVEYEIDSVMRCKVCEGNKWWKDINGVFHCAKCEPDYVGKAVGEEVFDNDSFIRWEWSRQRGGELVPFSDEQLNKLKELWRSRLARFCRRHGIEFKVEKIDIYVEFIDEWQKLHHRFNYNGRHWTENYAEYSNVHLDAPEPPEWLQHYENKSRVFGWWTNIKNFTTESKEKEKISPYTGEKMTYIDSNDGVTVDSLLRYANILGYVEFIKGKPVESDMTEEQIEWLKGVMFCKAEGQEVDGFDLDAT